MNEKIIDKVRKLLRLSESSNANEAALAAAKAQALIDTHNLSIAMLSIETESTTSDEPIEDFYKKGAPLDQQKWHDRWRTTLASTIAKANGCRIYLSGGATALVGRASDAETVRYLYGYLTHEVTRLCERDGKGCGWTWRNNYRLGVVETISNKLKEQRQQFNQEARSKASENPQALMRVDKALARIEEREASVGIWMRQNLRLRAGGRSSAKYHDGAREAGRRAGESISINRARRGLTTGTAHLTS